MDKTGRLGMQAIKENPELFCVYSDSQQFKNSRNRLNSIEMPSERLTRQFIKGLEMYNITIEDISSGEWVYCGGDTGRHLNYTRIYFHDQEYSFDKDDKCVCGHAITENCYITKGTDVLILGNCCIKKFLPKNSQGRRCDKCDKGHRNRKVNRCNECRIGHCDVCYAHLNKEWYKTCWDCK